MADPKDDFDTDDIAQGDIARRAISTERTRVNAIRSMADRFKVDADIADDAISGGVSADAFRKQVLDLLDTRSAGSMRAGSTVIGLPHRRRHDNPEFSLVRALAAHETGDWSDAGYERECDQELRRSMGRSAQGFYVPTEFFTRPAMQEMRARALITGAGAPSLIGTEQAGNMFIDVLRPFTAVIGLGASVLQGLRQNVSIPRMTGGITGEWIAEDAEAAESTPTFDSVTLTMKQLSASTRMSRKQLVQAEPSLDAILRNDLMRYTAQELDRAAIMGAGTATEPRGILNTVGVPVVALGTNGAAIDYPELTALMAAVDASNVPSNATGYLTNFKVKAKLMGRLTSDGKIDPILTTNAAGQNMIAGTRAAFSSNVPSNLTKGTGTNLSAAIYGNWSDLLIGQWGGIDIITDNLTEKRRGNLGIVAHSSWDIAVRYAASFAICRDIIA
jgi:HK97 family phage major capsid protein